MTKQITIHDITIGGGKPLVLIAGPCVVESRELIMKTAAEIKAIADKLEIPFIFKSSYRKANRTNVESFTGLGDDKALEILAEAKTTYNVPLITDIHKPEEAAKAARYADILQIPAFLCRQTDLLSAAGETGKPVNIKKGQFLAPEDIRQAAEKVAATGNTDIMLTERGTSFGYHNLVVDMRSFVIMRETGYPVVMDATHSVQIPSQGKVSGGQPKFILPLASAAVAIGIDALFLEVHPDPPNALSDAGSQLPLNRLEDFLIRIKKLDEAAKSLPIV
jgi:2-dehydro-3-deoxyphosphooctonate aldolase (KDO 8-P synthase)